MGYRCGVFETGGVQLSFVGTLARISFPCPGREGARGKEKEGKGGPWFKPPQELTFSVLGRSC